MYSQAVSKDPIRPQMTGIHYEKERCYASNTRILIVYNEGSEKHNGKTLNVSGEEINGVYPAIDRMIPKSLPLKVNIDLDQLLRACSWYLKSDLSTNEDEVLIEDIAFRIVEITRLLTVLKQGNAIKTTRMYVGSSDKPALFKGAMFTAIIMPCNGEGKLLSGKLSPVKSHAI